MKNVLENKIKVGERYNYYDNGRISPFRHFVVEIKDIIPFNEIDDELWSLWSESVDDTYDLYVVDKPDYIIKAELEDVKIYNTIYLARTTDGGWFALNHLFSGRLDYDKSLTDKLIKSLTSYEDEYSKNFKPII